MLTQFKTREDFNLEGVRQPTASVKFGSFQGCNFFSLLRLGKKNGKSKTKPLVEGEGFGHGGGGIAYWSLTGDP